jgi:serine-type D-Ala-D-Ala carboxypeptidase/endopeptidase
MMRPVVACLLAVCISCGGSHGKTPVGPVKPTGTDADPEGPHRAEVVAQVQPMIDAELASGIVIGLYDAGKMEVYGFGKGPGGKPPTGRTLFELGPVSAAYTSLLLADTVQRRLVELDTPVSEFLPPGVTAPTAEKIAITLRHLAMGSSGLPTVPPSLAQVESPAAFAKYNEDALYRDLVHTQLVAPPGKVIHPSSYGVGLLAFALGKKLGGFEAAMKSRVLDPLTLHDTFLTVPASLDARRAQGTTDTLESAPRVAVGALAGALGMVSTARDQLTFLEAELDASAGGHQTLRPAMHLTQETQIENDDANVGLGWNVDSAERYWIAGSTPGFRSYISFDPKNRRAVVILSSTAVSLTDGLSRRLYDMLAGKAVPVPHFPDAAQMTVFAGTYTLQGAQLTVTAKDKRLYVEGPGEPPIRLLPISDHEFWIEDQQVVVVFDIKDGKVSRAIFLMGERQISAPRVTDKPPASESPSR